MNPLGAVYVQGVTRVADLLSPDGTSWSSARVDEMFSPDDAADIKQIAVGGPGTEDTLAWNYTKNGVFSVRSAYHLRMTMNKVRSGQPESSSSISRHKGYLGLWDTSAPNKAKIHMSRVIRNGLAVGVELHRRRIKPGVFCVVCGREETILHRFWSCQHSVQFWSQLRSEKGVSVAAPPIFTASQSELANWLLEWFATANEDEREMMIHSVYAMWLARNETRDGRRIEAPREIIERVCSHVKEWREVHAKSPRITKPAAVQRWSAPDEGWIKANSDGAISRHGGRAGGGVVLRDANGGFLASACHLFPQVVDPEVAEIMACKRALRVAADINVQKVHLELDCQSLVHVLKQPEKNLSVMGPWLEEIKTMLRSFEDFKVSWVRRSANVAAHKLAKVGVGEELCMV